MSTRAPPRNSGLKFELLKALARVTRRYHPRGTYRFLRTVYHPHKRQNDHLNIVVNYDSRLLINVDTASFIEWVIFFFGYFEPEVVRAIKTLVKPDAIIFDIGANIGCQTLIMASAAGKSGKVYAIEPHPEIYEKLLCNLELNRMTNVIPVKCAFSDVASTTTLYSFAEGSSKEGRASLFAANVKEHGAAIAVQTQTLDGFVSEHNLDGIDLIKVDVEGSDWKVILGGRSTIAKYLPYIIFEYYKASWDNASCNFSMAADFFANLGYRLFVLRGDHMADVAHGLVDRTNIVAVPPFEGSQQGT